MDSNLFPVSRQVVLVITNANFDLEENSLEETAVQGVKSSVALLTKDATASYERAGKIYACLSPEISFKWVLPRPSLIPRQNYSPLTISAPV